MTDDLAEAREDVTIIANGIHRTFNALANALGTLDEHDVDGADELREDLTEVRAEVDAVCDRAERIANGGNDA